MRSPGRRRAYCGLLVGVAVSIAGAASAQQLLTGTELGGVTFPVPSNLWVAGATRFQAAALADASARIGRTCGASEFHIWYADSGDRNDIQTAVDEAFAGAGWSLSAISAAAGEGPTYLAGRAGDELVLAWLPQSGAMGLVLCEITGVAAAAPAPADGVAAGAGEAVPLPQRRPDPIADIIAGLPPPPEPAGAPGVGVPPPAAAGVAAPAVAAADAAAPVAAADRGPAAGAGGEEPAAALPANEPAPAEAAVARGDEPGVSWLPLVLLVLAAVLGIIGVRMIDRGLRSGAPSPGASWPTTRATVVYSNVAAERRRGRMGRLIERFIPVVAYEYVVDGVLYRAARLSFADSGQADVDGAWRIADRFPVGAGIEVRYDPRSPVEATVETGSRRPRTRLLGGVAMVGLAAAALIGAFA